MDAMSLVDKFENHLIPEGGKEQYEGRIRLVDYILEKKPVTESGCRYCPHCLKETPTVFAICLACWTALESHGLKPYRIIEEEDEEATTNRQIDEEIRRNKETIFKDVVNEAQEGATQDNDYGFDPNEVDYDEEGDEEMDEAEDDEEIVADDEEEEEAGEAEAAPEAAKMPKWALNLDVGSIRLPATGMINNDSSEGAAALRQRCLGKDHEYVQVLLQAEGPDDARRLPRRDDDRPCRKAGPRWYLHIHRRERRWVASTSHRRGTRCHVPRQSQEGRVDARRNDVWGAPKGYADDSSQNIGDL